MHWGFGFGSLGMLLWWLLIIGVIVLAIKGLTNIGSSNQKSYLEPSKDAMEILKERYAKGEITEEEFTKMRRNLLE
ncbi:MAG: SHOCT domain-containing protein [Bacillota bacterium]|nr:SHOCT domain-containing protein [Bacillota bacterium]